MRPLVINEHSTRKCKHCDMVMPYSMFLSYKKGINKVGYRSRCKSCYYKFQKHDKNYSDKKEVYLREYAKNYLLNPKNLVKISARRLAIKALKNGEIIKHNCEVCGSDRNVEMHHQDYTKPLIVSFLCKVHHMEADKLLLKSK